MWSGGEETAAFQLWSWWWNFPERYCSRLSNKQTMRQSCHLKIARGIKTCRRKDKTKIGQKEMLRCDAGPARASGPSQKVLDLDSLSALS